MASNLDYLVVVLSYYGRRDRRLDNSETFPFSGLSRKKGERLEAQGISHNLSFAPAAFIILASSIGTTQNTRGRRQNNECLIREEMR